MRLNQGSELPVNAGLRLGTRVFGLNICSHFILQTCFFTDPFCCSEDPAKHEMMKFLLVCFLLLTQCSERSLFRKK